MRLSVVLTFLLSAMNVAAFSVAPSSPGVSIPSYTLKTKLHAKRGRGSLGREVSGGGNAPQRDTTGASVGGARSQRNWIPLSPDCQLPKQDNKIAFLDTNLPALKNGATNPTGAVACCSSTTSNNQKQVFCFQANCPSCQVPLSKAQVVQEGGQSVLVCNFCQSSYNLSSGQKVDKPASAKAGGLFSGVVSGLVSSNQDVANKPLTLYALGEKQQGKKKQLVIALD